MISGVRLTVQVRADKLDAIVKICFRLIFRIRKIFLFDFPVGLQRATREASLEFSKMSRSVPGSCRHPFHLAEFVNVFSHKNSILFVFVMPTVMVVFTPPGWEIENGTRSKFLSGS